ncbi:MAG: DUF371 domain-containing protein [Candidatus Woesearchaeota archaeon]
MRFVAYGHPNILCTHRNTFEFTKDEYVSRKGDCMVGVNANYDVKELRKLLNSSELVIRIRVGDLVEEINCLPNPRFSCAKELVVRRSSFDSERTLGLRADKAAVDFMFKGRLKDPNQVIEVEICEKIVRE